ncbi:hypothetical protein PPL_09077 [Heterostelium album PN500]|uniref:Ankyrin repeat protein n=1 Tax=Heterostelium pallidum (strain ATCC 26659 / Pp 5 / PN500) TaxID=670386 RepID=D3BKJ5_HETP5|nr:hypothetical protein PPL_09077 [Heterostelium album PN500]EFA78425.1 hypothetical protein PPL_09077 [Heterostelium album PN500]|eukprot:XP_020430550.1 hypothetical protein PPL_09077 [Heterostelium album PN500]
MKQKEIVNSIKINTVNSGYKSLKWNQLILSPIDLSYYGYLEPLRSYIESHPKQIRNTFKASISYAVQQGHLSVVEYLKFNDMTRQFELPTHLIAIAAKSGHINIIRFLLERNQASGGGGRGRVVAAEKSQDMALALVSAIEQGNLEIIKYLNQLVKPAVKQDKRLTRAMDVAASKGYLEVCRFLNENRTEGCTYKALESAIVQGHIDVVKYLYENCTHSTTAGLDSALYIAESNKQSEIINYLEQQQQ